MFIIRDPLRISLFLLVWVLLLNGFGIGDLEFVRHTEADRTLIAWEMNENDNFLVPTLLGSQILTKPPLYYWLAAFFQKFFGSHSESVSRFTSLFTGTLLVLGSYWFWFSFTKKKRLSALAAFALSTSVLFYILASIAEIDMTFGCFCALSLYSMFLLYERHSFPLIVLSAGLVFFAFLAKGPPVYFFIVGTFALLGIFDWFFRANSLPDIFKKALLISLALLLSLTFLLIWLIPLSNEVGWQTLQHRLDEEVLSRVVSYSERDRGPLFYLGALFVSSMPWSLFLIFALYHFFTLREKAKEPWHIALGGYLPDDKVRRLFVFSIITVLAGFFMLSLAQGKSSRYSFPLIPFVVNICVVLSPITLLKPYFKKLVASYRLIAIAALFLFAGMYVFVDLPAISTRDWLISGIFVVTASLIGLFFSTLTIWRLALPIIALLFFTVKVVQTHIYVPHRNASRSVKTLALELYNEVRSVGDPVYTLELFERWTVYYVKDLGLNIKRLTPEIVADRHHQAGQTLLLLDYDEEAWRYYQARLYSKEVRIVKIFPHPTSACFLLSVPNEILDELKVFSNFPTHPSTPFYPELKLRSS